MTYPSGTWRGFELHFDAAGKATGRGIDVVGPFTFAGTADPATGAVTLTKQYLGKHRVHYEGKPDGEGCIYGTWSIGFTHAGTRYDDRGNFLMKPELAPPTGDEPIVRIGRG
jgi:hypothetical protein